MTIKNDCLYHKTQTAVFFFITWLFHNGGCYFLHIYIRRYIFVSHWCCPPRSDISGSNFQGGCYFLHIYKGIYFCIALMLPAPLRHIRQYFSGGCYFFEYIGENILFTPPEVEFFFICGDGWKRLFQVRILYAAIAPMRKNCLLSILLFKY